MSIEKAIIEKAIKVDIEDPNTYTSSDVEIVISRENLEKAIRAITIEKEIIKIAKDQNTSGERRYSRARPSSSDILKKILELNYGNRICQGERRYSKRDLLQGAIENPNCQPEDKVKWMKNNGWISRFNPDKHEL